jgi:NADP-dependent 3-hydroxy acid dehydrogenase YdfG
MDLKGKVAIITGASGGIGSAVAKELHRAGSSVILTGTDREKLNALAADLAGMAVVAADITDPSVPQTLIETALKIFGRLDIVHNNAGVMRVGPIDTVDVEGLCQMIRINFEALVRLSYAALRHFKGVNSGFLINTSSIAGYKTGPTFGVYDGTKFAVEAFTDALRLELAGTGIRVSAIAPGTVDTGLYAQWDPKTKEYMYSGGALAPDDIARAVRFVLEQPSHVLIPRMLIVPAAQPV